MTNRPVMTAVELRYYVILKTLECRSRQWGDATLSQARSIAMRLDVVFKDSDTQRRDRLDVLVWIFGRRFASSKGLTRAEASATLDWLSTTPPDVIAQECQRCLVAARIEQGQLSFKETN